MTDIDPLSAGASAKSGARAVFLSYASEDARAAERMCTTLRAAGIEVWFDRSELRGGDAWDSAIRRQIKNCALFIPLISSNSHARTEGYFRLEWKLAVDRSHLMASDRAFLVPVVIDATPDSDDRIPERFREVHWMRLPAGETPPEFVQHIVRLLSLPEIARAESRPVADPPKSAPAEELAPVPATPAAKRSVLPFQAPAGDAHGAQVAAATTDEYTMRIEEDSL